MDPVLALFKRIPPGPVIAVLAILGIWALSNTAGATDRIPDLEGIRIGRAQARAAEQGYHTVIELREGPGIAGTVVAQQPRPGTLRGRGATITLVVTRGAPQVRVPNVIGMPVDQARSTLRAHGLTPGDVTFRSETGKEPNRVLSTDPRPGTTVDAGAEVHIEAAA